MQVFDYGVLSEAAAQGSHLIAGSPYLVMELASGGTLSSRCGTLDWLSCRAIPRVRTRGPAPKDPNKPYRGDVLDASFRRAWVAAEVPKDRWGKPEDALVGDRGHERPVHCMRAGVKTGLLRAGVEDALVDYLIGHGSSATHRAYVPLHDPAQSPYWPRLVEAVAKIPAYRGE